MSTCWYFLKLLSLLWETWWWWTERLKYKASCLQLCKWDFNSFCQLNECVEKALLNVPFCSKIAWGNWEEEGESLWSSHITNFSVMLIIPRNEISSRNRMCAAHQHGTKIKSFWQWASFWSSAEAGRWWLSFSVTYQLKILGGQFGEPLIIFQDSNDGDQVSRSKINKEHEHGPAA